MTVSPNEYRQTAEVAVKAKRFDEALQVLRQALEVSQTLQDQKEIADTLVALGDVSLQTGKGREAIKHYQQAEAIAHSLGETRIQGRALIGLGNVAQSNFNYSEAERYYRQALDLFSDSADSSTALVALHQLGQFLESQNRLDEARAIYQRVLASKALDPASQATLLLAEARVALAQKKPEESLSYAQDALQIANGLGQSEDHGEKAFALTLLGQAAFSLGKHDEGYSYLNQAMKESEQRGDQPGVAYVHRAMAELATGVQDFSRAQQNYQQALQIYQRIGSRHKEADMAMALAAVETVLGHREEAAIHVERAQEAYENLGDEANASRARNLLKEMQVVVEGGQTEQSRNASTEASQQQTETAQPAPEPTPAGVNEPSTSEEPGLSSSVERVLGMAERIRERDRHREILSTHLLLAMYMAAPDTSAHIFLSAFGVDYREVLQTLANSSEVEDLLMSKYGPEIVQDVAALHSSDSVREILQTAKGIAQSKATAEIQPRHVFAALLGKSDASATRWLNDTLSPEVTDWIGRTLAELDESQEPTVEAVQQRAVKAGLYIAPTGVRDNAADTDLLGFATHADALASIILREETVPPMVVGVYGPWGSGKSTFMQLVKKSLKQRAKLVGTTDRLTRKQRLINFLKAIPTRFRKQPPSLPRPELIIVEYDAWAYADAPKLWAGLVAQIAKELDAQLGFRGRLTYIVNFRIKQLRNALLWGLVPVAIYIGGQLWNVFNQSVLHSPLIVDGLTAISTAFWGIKYFQAQKQPVSASIETLTARFDTEPMSGVVHSIQDEVKNALNTKFPQPKREDSTRRDTTQNDIAQRVRENKLKLVVLIDELDRCPLERVVDILEAIKLFLSEEIFIVLMAIDTRVAAEAIRLHYKDVKNPDLPHEYLEKIVQLPLQVPRADGKALKDYLNSHMPTAAAAIKQDEEKKKKEDDKPPSTTNLDITSTTPPARLPTAQPHREPPVVRRADSISSRPRFSDTPTEFSQIAELSEKFLESNPRRIKRLLNTYRYVKMLANARHEPIDTPDWQKTTLAWLVFTMKWPAFMEEAYNTREKLGRKYLGSKNILKDALNNDNGNYEKPSAQDIDTYLAIEVTRLETLYESAGNFLIEIPMTVPENHETQTAAPENV